MAQYSSVSIYTNKGTVCVCVCQDFWMKFTNCPYNSWQYLTLCPLQVASPM